MPRLDKPARSWGDSRHRGAPPSPPPCRGSGAEDNLLGESSFISRVIASFWMKRVSLYIYIYIYTARLYDNGESVRAHARARRDVIAQRNERETLNEPTRSLSGRRLITHAITPQFAFRICTVMQENRG